MIITSAALSALNKGWTTLFMDAYQGGGATPRVDSYAMPTTSMSREEFYGMLAAVPGLRELVDEVQITNVSDVAFSIANKEFERTIAVKRKDIERDQFGVYRMLFPAMGTAARLHPDELLFAAMVAGFTSPCYTGKNFFDTNHEPVKGKTKFSNLNTKKLSPANYEAARNRLKSRLNTEGKPMNLGSDLVLVVSPNNESLARQILIADTIPNAAGTAASTNVNKGTARPDVCPLLASNPDMWFLLDLGYPIKPFINQVEKELEFQSLTNPSDSHVLLNKEWIYQAYRRGNVGYALPELAEGSTGTDAA